MNTTIRWVGGTVLVSMAFAYALVPTARVDWRPRSDNVSLRSEAWQTSARDLQVLKEIRLRAVSKALARALPLARSGDATFRFEAPLTAPSAARIERVMRVELDVVAPGGAAYPVAVIANADSGALITTYLRTVVLPEATGQPCVVVFSASPRNLTWPGVPATDRLLGTCGFYAAFGEPGAANKRWLIETQFRAAVHLQRPAALAADTTLADHQFFARTGKSDVLACQLGRADACLALLTPLPLQLEEANPWWRPSREMFDLARTAVPATESFSHDDASRGSSWIEAGLLAELAAELGAERFGQLWRDQRPLPESYAALEGRPLEAWIQRYVSRRVVPFVPGSGLLSLPLGLAIALALFSTFVGIRFARREMS